MMDNRYLESLINDRYQLVDSKKKSFYKCHKELLNVLDKWEAVSDKRMGNLIDSSKGEKIVIPTTCRYFTVGEFPLLLLKIPCFLPLKMLPGTLSNDTTKPLYLFITCLRL